tara:strand:- start:34 stop:777 length:744 start_codon:yes stop_codon:yes gene_type:complete
MIRENIVPFEAGTIKSSNEYLFLKKFEENMDLFKKAYEFCEDEDFLHEMKEVSGENQVQNNSWHIFPLYSNRNLDFYIDYLSEKLSVDVRRIIEVLRSNLPDTYEFLDEVIEENGIINLWFSRLKAQSTIKCHINNDPFQYRGHIGLQVPKGNVCLKVKDSIVRWREDRFFVFDTTEPHMAWNLTDEDRVVMSVDFFREPRQEMMRLHEERIRNKIKNTPLGFEGGYLALDPKLVDRFNNVIEEVSY